MSIDSLKGAADQEFGRLEEAVGDLIGDRRLQARGMLDRAIGAVEQVYGQANGAARDALSQAANGARGARGELEGFIDVRPMLATGLALGIGIVVGALLLGGGKAALDRR
jgi:uncharacterized protein YjbJ (UPF0337 family)